MIVRISKGSFDARRADEVEERLRESETRLRPALQKLRGMRWYWVGIDRDQGYITNTSLWDTLEDAQQMSTLREMLDLRAVFEALEVKFEPITNHEVLWEAWRERVL